MSNNFDACKKALKTAVDTQQYFTTSIAKPKPSWRYICIDYKPLSVISGTVLYGFLEGKDDAFNLCYRHRFSSKSVYLSALRRANARHDTIMPLAKRLIRAEAIGSADLEKLITEATLLDQYINTFSYPEDRKNYHTNLQEAINTNNTFKISNILDDIIKCVSDLCTAPDSIDDLCYYAAYLHDNSGEFVISDIPELSAVNIKTPWLQELETSKNSPKNQRIELDKYMFKANADMMRLYISSRTVPRTSATLQPTFSILSEFVPIAMKFTTVYNPILDNIFGGDLWSKLIKGSRMFRYAKVCTNKCSIEGRTFDLTDKVFDEENPGSYEQSRIYYAMCCHIDEIFGSNGDTPIVPSGKYGIRYSSDLAAATMLRLIEMNMQIDTPLNFSEDKAYLQETSREVEGIQVTACDWADKPLTVEDPARETELTLSQFYIFRAIMDSSLAVPGQGYDSESLKQRLGRVYNSYTSAVLSNIGDKFL